MYPWRTFISAGNYGLCYAWDKYNPNKVGVREMIIDDLRILPKYTPEEIKKVCDKHLNYGDLHDKLVKKISKKTNFDDIMLELNKVLKPAKFSSVAVMWIRASIISELDNTPGQSVIKTQIIRI